MIDTWEIKKLGGLTTKLGSGVTPRGGKKVYQSSGIPLVRSQNVYNEYFTYDGLAYIPPDKLKGLENVAIEKNDNLINITGDSVARSTIAPDNVINGRVNQHVMIVRADENQLNYRYLHYFLTSVYTQKTLLSLADSGGTRKALTKDMMSELDVPVPPLPTQERIADILGTLDDKIELNRQMNHTLEAMARAIFKSWFVDFDPVYAKMEGRSYPLPAAVMDLFPDELVESELGLIPQGWEVGQLKDGFNITMGQSPPGSTYNEDGEGLPFYQGRRDFGFRYPTLRVYCNAPKRLANPNDTLVSVRAPVGDVNMAKEECCIGRGVAAVRHKSGSASFTYYSMLKLKEYFNLFESEGTVFGSISKNDFEGIEVIKPPDELIQSFENIVGALDKKIENNSKQIETLTSIRDTLLPKLISGEVEI